MEAGEGSKPSGKRKYPEETTMLIPSTRFLATLCLTFALAACGGGESGPISGGSGNTPTGNNGNNGTNTNPVTTPPVATPGVTKSAKRGIAYDLASKADFVALAPGISWWYNWASRPNASAPADADTAYAMDFMPMLWNDNFDATAVETWLLAHPKVKYVLLLNEPNLTDQANLTPAAAAAAWPRYESIAARTGVKLVGPTITWGTMPGYADPVVWLDAFYTAYRAANANRDPRIDYLAFHWYDYGLGGQLDRLAKYGKPFWVTEFANWHSNNDGAQIDTVEKQKRQMQEMVAICEQRTDVFRYAWFTGRWNNDTHYTSLLAADGELTELGKYYLTLPF